MNLWQNLTVLIHNFAIALKNFARSSRKLEMREMLKTILVPLALALLLLLSNGSDNSVARLKQVHNGSDNSVAHVKQINNPSDNSVARFKQNSAESAKSQTGTLEKMIVADGSVAMDIDLGLLNRNSSPAQI